MHSFPRCISTFHFDLEHVYISSEVNSNRFEISNHFEKSFHLHGNFTAANLEFSNPFSEDNELLQDDQKIASELNTFFKNAVSNLNVNENTYIINHDSGNLSDPVGKAICKYKFHPSILLIKSK